MNEVLAIGLQAMRADMARLELAAANFSNVLTAGYKRGEMRAPKILASFASHFDAARAPEAANDPQRPVAVSGIRYDLRPGTLRATGRALDVALTGKGFLEVITPQGPAYTRQGNLRLDAQGRLVTAQGYAVQGLAGDITLTGGKPVFTHDGRVLGEGSSLDAPLAELKLVEFDTDVQLQPIGEGLFAAPGAARLLPREEKQVRQGFLENSNVRSGYEMTQLVRAMRHLETMQKLTQACDEMLGTAIRKLGEGS
jgi:flagellar basal-body rod protein FlgG